MMRKLYALYAVPRYASTLAYMLQSTEYSIGSYLAWFWRTQDFSRVMYRRELDKTKAAVLLRLALIIGMGSQIFAGLALISLWRWHGLAGGGLFGLALLLSYPIVWAHLVLLPMLLGRELSVRPKERRLIQYAETIFAKHPGVKIAVAGSYGKTSMKELLVTVLGEGKKVAATPANKNVLSSHALFAQMLTGDEEILVIEYGEGQPGDIKRFADLTHPTHGIITGLAPAHLDQYKTLQAAGDDIFSLASYLHGKNVYVNGEPSAAQPFLKESYEVYDARGALGWQVRNIKLSLSGTEFELVSGPKKLKLHSGLLGRHQVGPLALAAALALEFGLSHPQVVDGVAATAPFEHRMQPYRLGGAWIIDDTYNGNIEGVQAGTELLGTLSAQRKWYITPGLVDQGTETQAVHERMGELIAAAQPDIVVLMQNSVTHFIQKGLMAHGFAGEVRLETEPLHFYQNLEHQVAAGDLLLMQNDWTDNYY